MLFPQYDSIIFKLITKSFLRSCFRWGRISELVWAFDLQQAITVRRMGIHDQSIWTCTQPSILRKATLMPESPFSCLNCRYAQTALSSLSLTQVNDGGTDWYGCWFMMEFTSEIGRVYKHNQIMKQLSSIVAPHTMQNILIVHFGFNCHSRL